MICTAVLAPDFIVTSASIGLYSHLVEQDCSFAAPPVSVGTRLAGQAAAAVVAAVAQTHGGPAAAQDLPPVAGRCRCRRGALQRAAPSPAVWHCWRWALALLVCRAAHMGGCPRHLPPHVPPCPAAARAAHPKGVVLQGAQHCRQHALGTP